MESRWKARATTAAAGCLLVALVAGALVACGSPAVKPVAVKADAQTRLTAPAATAPTTTPTTVAVTTTSPPPANHETTTTAAARLAHQAATTTTLGCVMSHDPRCGPMWFNPAPSPDQPVHLTVTASPAHPTDGQAVTFHVVMDDPDGPIGCVQSVSDGQTSSVSDCGLSPPCDRFGAWAPPPPAAGHTQQDITATYRRPGQYTFTITVVPNSSSCTDARTHRGEQPYVSAGSGSLSITVT